MIAELYLREMTGIGRYRVRRIFLTALLLRNDYCRQGARPA
ncbi:hypothetical protein EN813_045100 [Mesorhizobium sp. M00.F.Ca.ET.170.01.1.1]|nr:hypothetical protein EN813_045100 [Mesorhizobium sp. M00.F.Ca.ET.170.01.1.1]